jgi:spoIIIJ-associated protein
VSSLEFEGKNVDKAVKAACDELNVTADEISYEILSRGSSGIFGLAGKKNARIKVVLPNKTREINPGAESGPRESPVFEEEIEVEPGESASLDDSNFDTPQRPRTDESPLDLSRAVLQRIVDAITSDATISAEETGDRILLKVACADAGALIGKKGQTLEAIQTLVDKIVNKHNNHHHDRIRVQVDVEGYLATRKLNLEKLATRLADKSKKIRKPISLGQMNGYDRRIVHLALKDDPEVQTRSRGEGYMRKLVIFPQKTGAPRQPSH